MKVLAVACFAFAAAAASAQGGTPSAPAVAGWQACAALAQDPAARLACFDRWATQQTPGGAVPAASAQAAAPPASAAPHATATTADTASAASAAPAAPPPPVDASLPATRIIAVDTTAGCRDGQYSELSRLWELESGTDCGTFGIRGYRPISLSLIAASSVNRQPSSDAPDHTAPGITPYRRTETRIQLSVRTKIAQGILTGGHPSRSDSLWFGYTQQSYWQLFNRGLSRPFRTTDHEPEVMYVYPTDAKLPLGWRLRYNGVGLVHQSNGQALPLSRSWNRVYLMGGLEKGNDFNLQGRVWRRLPEGNAHDDNPGISNYIGRAEVAGTWHFKTNQTLGATVRTPLNSAQRGSVRFEWMRPLGSREDAVGLRLHTQLFSGYGDSLIDYNRRRTVLSVGLSLVDF
ncbi:MAG: phospholipase A [Burkholderiaceae bacterium]|nr:phospholipase A [Burkholderiaceae bacterium]